MYDMHDNGNTDAEGVLEDKSEDYEVPMMATGLSRQVPMSEVNDNDMNYSVLIPRGNTYSRGKVIRRKIYSSHNDVGRMNDNPILDTREYCVEVDDGEIRKLMANVILESI